MKLEDLGYLSVGSQMRRIYEKLQAEGDKIYTHIDVGFKSTWFPIYYVLLHSKRALTIKEITERISYSRITVKNVVSELEKNDFVKIIQNPTDSRSKLIQLTKKGRKIEDRLQKVWTIIQSKLELIFKQEKSNNFLIQLEEINHQINTKSMAQEVLKDYYNYKIRNAKQEEFEEIGNLLVNVYSQLNGFPKIDEYPEYYATLKNVGDLTKNPNIELFVAVSEQNNIGGAVVYFNDMKDYGSAGSATKEKNACGFRLLGVNSKTRGLGLGKKLTQFCIEKGKNSDCKTMVIHTTNAMKLAWAMYEKLGFKRADDLDFMQGNLPVFGFRLKFR